MDSWLKNDLKVVGLELRMLELKKEFDERHNQSEENYDAKLRAFLSRKLKHETEEVLREQFVLILPIISETERFI